MSVNNNNSFAHLVHVEQMRGIESVQSAELSYASVTDMENQSMTNFKYDDFTQRLITRAKHLIRDNELEAVVAKPFSQFKLANGVCMIIAGILGGLVAVNAVSDVYTLNIYWLLTVLLGFNLLSLLLWTIGISLNIQGLSSGVAAQLTGWWPFRNKKQDTVESQAMQAWRACCLSGSIGKWRISVLTHQFWLIYLTAGLVLLILLMLAKQYNFIWGTTLLPDSSLPKLTATLGKPLTWVGLETPDTQQIATSRMGTIHQDAQTRNAWAQFLIGVLLFYGLLPRLLLIGLSVWMLKWSEHRFKLDLYLPYYIDLRQRMMTRQESPKIIDADPFADEKPVETTFTPTHNNLPANAYVIGIELDDRISWPDTVSCQLNIIDQQTQEEAIQWVKTLNGPLLIGVAAYRLPDRGIQRIVKDLLDATQCNPWFLLLNKKPPAPVASNRELSWFRLAETCNIPAEQVIIH